VLPDRLAWKWESEAQGAFKLKFCHSGKYLAAACTLANGKTIIKIFHTEEGYLAMALRGHNDLVHDICWSPDDRFLVTASADGACRIWTLDSDGIGHADKLNYQGNDEHFFVCELYHPSFVYGAKLHPTRQEGFLYIATVCFDNKVRVWSVNVSDPQNPWYKLETEVSIEEPPNFTLGTKKTIYEHEEDLEDETLRLIMNP
jgi:WD40 repeat protein